MIAIIAGPEIASALMPLQLGSGVPCGVEVAARCNQLALDANEPVEGDPFCLVSLDQQNAFNSIPRRTILDGLLELFPQLARWFIFPRRAASWNW